MDMNILKYMAFIKTVEYGSFTKAAEILHYSQSGISRMISDLEKEWKVSLLRRSRAGVQLSSDGQRLLPYAQRVCEEYQKLQNKVCELNGIQSGLIRIGTFSSVATHWLPNIIKEFQKDYPNIDYELLLGDYTEIEEWIMEGRVDCGFLRLPTHPDLETIFLEQDKLLVILPENHPLAKYERIPVTALNGIDFIIPAKEQSSTLHDVILDFAKAHSIEFNIVQRADNILFNINSIGMGLGCTILPGYIAPLTMNNTVIRSLDVELPYLDLYASYRKDRNSVAVDKFIELLTRVFYLDINRTEG